jgi:hypothetical protein
VLPAALTDDDAPLEEDTLAVSSFVCFFSISALYPHVFALSCLSASY